MIVEVASSLPGQELSNDTLAALYPDWPAEKILEKTGIRSRRVAGQGESASGLAIQAAKKVLSRRNPDSVDALLYCTQSPDYIVPASACVIHHKLGLPSHAAALDFHIGCSGYIYGLALANNFIVSGQCRSVLLLTADTYSRYIAPEDKSTRTIFGDAGSATLLENYSENRLHSFVFGTDGSGAEKIVVRHTDQRLVMDGPEVFNFTLERVPGLVEEILMKASLTKDQVDLWIFHQANGFMLEHLRRKLGIEQERFVLELERCGNTVSSSIPLALESQRERFRPGMRILLAGFGAGYSWAGCILEWNQSNS